MFLYIFEAFQVLDDKSKYSVVSHNRIQDLD
jgi:hypothetical protein